MTIYAVHSINNKISRMACDLPNSIESIEPINEKKKMVRFIDIEQVFRPVISAV